MPWDGVKDLGSRSYVCGHCGDHISAQVGYRSSGGPTSSIYICHVCGMPTMFIHHAKQMKQIPGSAFGTLTS